jgi:hypothetical protein
MMFPPTEDSVPKLAPPFIAMKEAALEVAGFSCIAPFDAVALRVEQVMVPVRVGEFDNTTLPVPVVAMLPMFPELSKLITWVDAGVEGKVNE